MYCDTAGCISRTGVDSSFCTMLSSVLPGEGVSIVGSDSAGTIFNPAFHTSFSIRIVEVEPRAEAE